MTVQNVLEEQMQKEEPNLFKDLKMKYSATLLGQKCR